MKLIASFLVMLCACFSLHAQISQVMIHSDKPDQEIHYRELTAGKLPFYYQHEALGLGTDSDGNLTLIMALTQPFTLQCIVGDKEFRLHLTPDSKDQVTILKDSLIHSGTNACYNQALQVMDETLGYFQSLQINAKHELRKVSEVNVFKEVTESKRRSTLERLEEFKLDPVFLSEQNEHLQLAILSAWYWKFASLSNQEGGLPEEWKNQASLLLNQPLNSQYACSYPDFEGVAELYAFCFALFIERTDLRTVGDTVNTFKFHEYYRHLQEPAREYALAFMLYNDVSQERFSKDIPALYEKFFLLYPESKYATFLKPQQEKALRFQQAEFDSIKYRILPSEPTYAHLTDVIRKKFAGRVVYVDLWATWCGPCRRMFSHLPHLKEATKELDIDFLYVSVDHDDQQDQWLKMIPFYNLGGYHIRARGELHESLYSDFGNERQLLAIPRYIIVGKDGQIAIAEAAEPDNPDEVVKQLLRSGATLKKP